MTIKIEFPAERKDIALAIGQALVAVAGGTALTSTPTPSVVVSNEPTVDALAAADMGKTATSADGSDAQSQLSSSTPAETPSNTSTDSNVDTKGVAFDADYCAKAQDPFYASGKREGQWKKRKGVSDDDYDQWYADQLLGGKVEDTEQEADTTGQAANAAFGQAANTANAAFGQQTDTAAETPSNAPSNPGELMVWVSEQQQAGRITDGDVAQAWQQVGTDVGTLFTKAPAEQAGIIAGIHAILSAKAGA